MSFIARFSAGWCAMVLMSMRKSMPASIAAGVARGVANQVFAARVERRFGEPAEHGVDLLGDRRQFAGG